MSYQILKLFVTPRSSLVNLKRNICTHRILYGTHYDTLKLPRNCTTKEVRDSFIRLSKQCHPDKNRDDPNTHAQFVKLNEAYSVLSRPDRRQTYDLTLKPISTEKYHKPRGGSPFDVYTTAYRQRVVWRDESFWEYKDKTSYNDQRQSSGYYGIRGVRRVPNGWIAIMCVVFAAVGLWLQVLLIRYSTAFNRQTLDERSQEASRVLADVQERAVRHGNKIQLEILKHEAEKSSRLSKKTPTSVPPEDPQDSKYNTTSHPMSKPHESEDPFAPSVNLVPKSKMQEPEDNFEKPYLGYLGDMPHRVERNNLNPVLCNTPNCIDKETQTVVSNQNLPKPVVSVIDKTSEYDSANPVLFSLSYSITKGDENSVPQPVLCSTPKNVVNRNGDAVTEQNSINPMIPTTSNNAEIPITDANLFNLPENGETYISPVTNGLFPLNNKLSFHNSHILHDHERQRIEPIRKTHFAVLEHSIKQKNVTARKLPETFEPALSTDIILKTDSGIFCENLIPNRMR